MTRTHRELTRLIRQRIEESNGWLPFDAFMHNALYAPGLGYYESATVFGQSGDFVTGPDLGPWLGLAFADLIRWGWGELGKPQQWCLVEQGGGSGRLLCGVIHALERTADRLPTSIVAIEASELMRERQHALYQHEGIDVRQLADIHELEGQENCIMFCNELPDAFPVRCFIWHDQAMLERGVVWAGDGFAWGVQPLADPPAIDPALIQAWEDGYASEWNPGLSTWQSGIAGCMHRGYILSVDYGYAGSEYYRPQRREGTLLAHVRHQATDDVLSEPGSRDITAHVDFTAMGRAGMQAGMDVCCWMSQGAWLAQSPSVQKHIRQLAATPDAKSLQEMASGRRMIMPQGMGELFKLCVQSQNIPAEGPSYLVQFNRAEALPLT